MYTLYFEVQGYKNFQFELICPLVWVFDMISFFFLTLLILGFCIEFSFYKKVKKTSSVALVSKAWPVAYAGVVRELKHACIFFENCLFSIRKFFCINDSFFI